MTQASVRTHFAPEHAIQVIQYRSLATIIHQSTGVKIVCTDRKRAGSSFVKSSFVYSVSDTEF